MREYYEDYHIKRDHPEWKTLGDIISERYSDFTVIGGSAPIDMDVSHGVEIETFEGDYRRNVIDVTIYPYVKWSDGRYSPCHYWGSEYYLHLEKR